MKIFENSRQKIAEFIATIFYVGKTPYAPGTFGSLVAFPILILTAYYITQHQLSFQFLKYSYGQTNIVNVLITIFVVEITITLLIFVLGMICVSIYLTKTNQDDPKEVVIDELAGQMLTVLLSCFSLLFTYDSELLRNLNPDIVHISLLFIFPFILFRFFDIYKPWPISWCDRNIKGAFGVMFDDLLAAIFASISQYILILLVDDIAFKLNM